MTITNHEYYVSLEVAKLLKEAGFDWECKEYYYNFATTGWSLSFDDNFVNWNSWSERYISDPTLEVTQRWLREIKGIEVYAHVFYDSREMLNELDVYVYEVNHITKHVEDYISSYDIYHTYEEAQEAGIKKVLEMILEKGELSNESKFK